jgi:spermidine synthase
MEATVEIAASSKIRTGAIALLFAPTIFLSAFLLFVCEPMVGKMMLPLLGGAASVWITCLLFFQLMLLVGYGYVHAIERYADVRMQMLVHAVLMLVVVFFLPIHFGARPGASASAQPTLWLLAMLIRSVGIPFCIVSTTAPLLQNWLSKTSTASGRDPYFLYAVSNAGSLLALLAYPIAMEPRWGVRLQSSAWAVGYGLLFLMVVSAAKSVWRHLDNSPPKLGGVAAPSRKYREATATGADGVVSSGTTPPFAEKRADGTPPNLGGESRLFWVAAAFVPSGLMLAVTNHMLLNLASVPFLWVIPLATYLVTFMIAFARRFRIPPRIISALVPIVLLVLLPLVAVSRPVRSHMLWYVLGSHILVLFAGALLCHTALASRRPDTSQLTEFYFWVALGGALGGIFVAVLAPFVFSTVIEYPLLVAMIAFFRETRELDKKLRWADWMYPAFIGGLVALAWYLFKWAQVEVIEDLRTSLSVDAVIVLAALLAYRRRIRFALALAVLLAGYRLALPGFLEDYQVLKVSRDFFGIKKVVFELDSNMRKLLHGDTLHGLESMDPTLSGQPLSYYHETGPVGDIMKLISSRPNQQVAVVGLGTATMAGWALPDRHITFFDVDPQVHDIAQHFFTYLRRCAKNCDVVIGDGRLSIEKTPDAQFDVLMLDAFSSDSIPAHLVSREAVQLYLKKLKPGGLILFHVSNRYMDVESLVEAVAFDAGLEGYVRYDDDEEATGKTSSDYVVVARRHEDFGELNENEFWTKIEKPARIQAWTDDYSNMMAIVRWR